MWRIDSRLTSRLLALVTVLWLLGAGLALALQWYEMGELLSAAQEEVALNLLSLPMPSASGSQIGASTAAGTVDRSSVLSQVFSGSGQLIWRSAQAPEKALASLAPAPPFDQGDRRLLVRRAPNGDRVVIVAASLRGRREALIRSGWALVLPLPLLWPLLGLASRYLVRRTFLRVERLTADIHARSASMLSPLPVAALPGELTPMVAEINRLFGQLAGASEAERSFAAHCAHELRGPIAAAQLQAQRLGLELGNLPGIQPEQQSALAERVSAMSRQLQALNALCVKLLDLSRASAGGVPASAPVNLTQLASMVVDEFGPSVREGRLQLELLASAPRAGESGEVMVRGDIDSLAIALRKLIENALAHGGAQCSVCVRVLPLPAIDVIDNGPGIPPHELSTLIKPFLRGASTAPGHGLGLAIAHAIAGQMHGGLELVSPHEEGPGLRARLRLSTYS
jgi:two-component system OmpR family sensor kinase